MSQSTVKESMEFQTEVNQLLQLMIHSLYSNKEIFLRELISNASDACDKLRFEAISNDALYENDPELRVEVEFDEAANTVTVRDNGIGMSREEVINNIGTIAKSGTKEFLSKLTGDQAKDSQMIGQFGVGFYSSFIVAERVVLTTRRAGTNTADGVRWESDAQSGYDIEITDKTTHGTEVILHLKEDEKEFASGHRLRNIIKTYSDHIEVPIKMIKEEAPAVDEPAIDETSADENGEKAKEAEPADKPIEWETINSASALWQRPKNEISKEEYEEFYKHITYDYQAPLTWMHNKVEGNLEYTSLLFMPAKAPFDLWEMEQRHGVKLYVRRVFIMDDTENKLMPRYLRFVRGVIDSNDLPLNVSREILQSNKVIETIKKASVKRILNRLDKMASEDSEQYQTFWDEFGNAIKEGPVEDFSNREKVLKLLRFASTANENDTQNVSLDDYIGRMKAGQDKIYFITADNYAAAKNSPHLEVFRKKGIEVLLMHDRVDEWLMGHVQEFDGKSFQSVAKGDLDLGDMDSEEDKQAQEKIEQESADLINRIKEELSEKVEDVRVSHRLTDSASCIVLSEHEMALYMQQLMKQAGQDMPTNKPVLEINPTHPLLKRMEGETDKEGFSEWTSLLFDQAILAEGGNIEDPAGFVHRLNKLMLNMA
jgi:molecular chaperone HtpG